MNNYALISEAFLWFVFVQVANKHTTRDDTVVQYNSVPMVCSEMPVFTIYTKFIIAYILHKEFCINGKHGYSGTHHKTVVGTLAKTVKLYKRPKTIYKITIYK